MKELHEYCFRLGDHARLMCESKSRPRGRRQRVIQDNKACIYEVQPYHTCRRVCRVVSVREL